MRNVILYIAMSLDGYIAANNHSVTWLDGDGSDEENPGSYPDFIKSVDTVVMGNTTYQQIINELSPDYWVYHDKITYVVTSKDINAANNEKSVNTCLKNENIVFINNDAIEFIKKIKKDRGKDIWICGGANIAKQLIEADLIDSYQISVIPTLLGSGIKLFSQFENELKLKLISTKNYNGIVDLHYSKR